MKFIFVILIWSTQALAQVPRPVWDLVEAKVLPPTLQNQFLADLARQDISFHILKEQDKQKYSIPVSIFGFAGSRDRTFRIQERTADADLNQLLSQAVTQFSKESPELFKNSHTIFVQDTLEVHKKHNLILILFHELAHIRLTEWLNVHISQMLGRFPENLIFRDNSTGQIIIDAHFLTYLQERYAHENEFELFRFLRQNREFMPVIPSKWLEFMNLTGSSAAHRKIAQNIRQRYRIHEPFFASLDGISVTEILTGKP